MVIGHEISIEPVQHFGAVFLPEFQIAGKADALCREGARLFEPEREAAEIFGKLLRKGGILRRLSTATLGALEKKP